LLVPVAIIRVHQFAVVIYILSVVYVLERFQFVLVERVVVVVRARARVSGRDESVRVDHFFVLFFLSIGSFSRRLSRVVLCHDVFLVLSAHLILRVLRSKSAPPPLPRHE
jgi:hypothetical protein